MRILQRLRVLIYKNRYNKEIYEYNLLDRFIKEVDSSPSIADVIVSETANRVQIEALKVRSQLIRDGFNNIELGDLYFDRDMHKFCMNISYKTLPVEAMDSYKSMTDKLKELKETIPSFLVGQVDYEV